MADTKETKDTKEQKDTKYWYFRFRENFFGDQSIIKMQVLPGGFEFIVILLKLFALSTSSNGILPISAGPDGNIDIVVLTALLGRLHTEKIVGCALEQFIKDGLIELVQTNEEIQIICPEVQNMIGSSSSEADKRRALRGNKKPSLPEPDERRKQCDTYGEFENILLTKEEYQKFFRKYENAKTMLERASVWKARKNIKGEENDYALLLTFAEKDGKVKKSELEMRQSFYERYKTEAELGFPPPESMKEILTEMQFEELQSIAAKNME